MQPPKRRGAQTIRVVRPAQYFSRKGFLYSLPVGKRGILSMKSTLFGHFSFARCCWQKAINSACSCGPASKPGTACTTALTSSPISSLGTPNTAASATLGA